ncbi:MAG: Mrp/NBP35 family ATP-binding protein [Solobacterium sp.]|nr:Mrp/NBP35 family ATP-binding protein [Solobacterium sp.]
MSETNSGNCNHDCGSCSANCGDRTQPQDLKISLHPRSSVKHVIGIVSGKGGVGKSFVASLLASELQRRGCRTAVLDGDITGPSMARVFGITEKMFGDGELAYPAKTGTGIQIVSANMMLDTEDQPVIWRGPIVAGVIRQFYQEVFWDDVDYMVVDMPPGTSDVPLTVFQSLPLEGIIVVSSPQELVGMVVEKAINMANMMEIPLLGLIENMSYVECGNCGNRIEIFGKSHIDEISAKYNVPVLAKIPMREGYAGAGDQGAIEKLDVPEIKAVANAVMKAS